MHRIVLELGFFLFAMAMSWILFSLTPTYRTVLIYALGYGIAKIMVLAAQWFTRSK